MLHVPARESGSRSEATTIARDRRDQAFRRASVTSRRAPNASLIRTSACRLQQRRRRVGIGGLDDAVPVVRHRTLSNEARSRNLGLPTSDEQSNWWGRVASR
jgi:hypothetical protein